MPGSDPDAQFLDVPGARLYYERRGAGPLLLMIGSPMDSTGFAGLAHALADRYTVVIYDPAASATAPARTPPRTSRPSSRPTMSTACCPRSAAARPTSS